jgi:hypothetical protein
METTGDVPSCVSVAPTKKRRAAALSEEQKEKSIGRAEGMA